MGRVLTGFVTGFLGLCATAQALNGGAQEWLWVGGLIVLASILILWKPVQS